MPLSLSAHRLNYIEGGHVWQGHPVLLREKAGACQFQVALLIIVCGFVYISFLKGKLIPLVVIKEKRVAPGLP